MKFKPGWIVFGLLAVLALAAGLLMADRADSTPNPSILNVKPSGLAGLQELLKADGMQVELSRSARPKLSPKDLAVVVFRSTDNPSSLQDLVQPNSKPFEERMKAHLASGGRVLFIVMRRDFDLAAKEAAQPIQITSHFSPRETLVVNWSTTLSEESPGPSYSRTGIQNQTWYANIGTLARYVTSGPGAVIRLEDGVLATNRFLDESDNARLVLSLARSGIQPGGKVVFAEAAIGNVQEEGIFTLLGPWAVAARWQALLLFVVIVVTLGIRFGQPVRKTVQQRGSREMVDALGDLLLTGRKRQYALDQFRRSALDRVRKAVRAPHSATESQLLDRASEEFRSAWLACKTLAIQDKVRSKEMMEAALKLQSALEAFERDTRTGGRTP